MDENLLTEDVDEDAECYQSILKIPEAMPIFDRRALQGGEDKDILSYITKGFNSKKKKNNKRYDSDDSDNDFNSQIDSSDLVGSG